MCSGGETSEIALILPDIFSIVILLNAATPLNLKALCGPQF
jgi:hypothetical protein